MTISQQGIRGKVFSLSLRVVCETMSWLSLLFLGGGTTVLGAIVAPLVFRRASDVVLGADIMTSIFLRFDRAALVGAWIFFFAEMMLMWWPWFGWARKKKKKQGLDSSVSFVLACLLVLSVTVLALALGPKIAALHEAGCIRKVGDCGLDLDRVHHLAETTGKISVFTVILLVIWKCTITSLTLRGLSPSDSIK